MNEKKYVSDVLDYLKWQVENNRCSISEIESISKVISKEVNAMGTISDFAEFYGKSEANVRNVISRSYIPKPERKVMRNFAIFAKLIPKGW